MKPTLLLSILISCCFHSFSQNTDLSYKLEKGSDYKLSTTTNITINQEVNGQLMKMDMKLESVLNFFIKDIQNEEYMLEVKYERLEMENTVRDQTMRYNSDSDNEYDLLSKTLSEMTENSFSCSMTKDGKMSYSSGFDDILENILDSLAGISPNEKSQLELQLKKAFGSEAFKKSIETALHIYPDSPVRLNERWWIESTIGADMITGRMEGDYILLEEGDEYYKINGNSWFRTNTDSTFNFFGMAARSDLEVEYATAIKVNKINGWIIQTHTEYSFEGEIMINPNAQLPDGMKIPFRMKATMEIK
ncbi:MAG: hypothetical protein KKA81_09095 [Bacteroidetes bacterium]|nr:hypothetical protein [Bacteroidota bacterium]